MLWFGSETIQFFYMYNICQDKMTPNINGYQTDQRTLARPTHLAVEWRFNDTVTTHRLSIIPYLKLLLPWRPGICMWNTCRGWARPYFPKYAHVLILGNLGLHYRYKHSICAYISFTYYIYPNICLNRCCVLYLPVNKMDKRWREGKSLLFNYIHLSLKYRGQSFIRPA